MKRTVVRAYILPMMYVRGQLNKHIYVVYKVIIFTCSEYHLEILCYRILICNEDEINEDEIKKYI